MSGFLASILVSTSNNDIIKRVDNDSNNGVDMANVESSWSKTAKFENVILLKERKMRFFTLEAKLAFAKSRQALIKALILYHFHPKYHI